ncbi:UDP-glucose:undecaprenyl-phosphate glucose-1-phosphate transferase [Aduncisulcus paluster]|uniref:UDP-glucose:undecaprenyl-phosphate glucose-1-phosphate transferase n=1 Tax=Aduncisulcus paluster TaxID=2918883 RepID=A0ABQ5L1F5_9EUKA|nr:UDP-glucose:undecaprenyl-phosphate glucose-1-phosphate transferase [Aduncisulcus paluster]
MSAGHRATHWGDLYGRWLLITDSTIVAAAGWTWIELRNATNPMTLAEFWIRVVFFGYWALLLGVYRSRDPHLMGSGGEEYQRVLRATFHMFGLFAIVSVLFKFNVSRFALGMSLIVGIVFLLLNRKLSRMWLNRQRARGKQIFKVVVLGGDTAALNLAEAFGRDTALGYRVVGVCVPGYLGALGQNIEVVDRVIPILGSEDRIVAAVTEAGADTVAVTATEQLGPEKMRELAWHLSEIGVSLLVSPGVFDVDQPRVRVRPAGSMPLIHLAEPQYEGASRLHKVLFDRIGALLLIIGFSPLLLAPFRMIKFRSMVVGADKMVAALMAQNDGAGPLFKMREDPRVTMVGRFLRRTSLDELPQLFNVLRGEMSLVGPRPPLRREVEEYTEVIKRRLLVKPGMTGLWQVSGRSDLPWDEAVRLDLSYVENWSMVSDVSILWRTFRAVARSDGAY